MFLPVVAGWFGVGTRWKNFSQWLLKLVEKLLSCCCHVVVVEVVVAGVFFFNDADYFFSVVVKCKVEELTKRSTACKILVCAKREIKKD